MSKKGIVISTSRKPSQRTRSLCKELQTLLPSAVYIQRGKMNFEDLLKAREEVKAQLLILVGERDGNPGSLDLYSAKEVEESVLSFEIDGVRLAREYGSNVRSPSKALDFSSDSRQDSVDLQRLLEGYFKGEPRFSSDSSRGKTRTLSISQLEEGRLRLTFRDSVKGSELGPSMTGRRVK